MRCRKVFAKWAYYVVLVANSRLRPNMDNPVSVRPYLNGTGSLPPTEDFEPKHSDREHNRSSKQDEQWQDMIQIEGHILESCWARPYSGPLQIFPHIPYHLCMYSSIKPPSNCSIEVGLDINESILFRRMGKYHNQITCLQGAYCWKVKCCNCPS